MGWKVSSHQKYLLLYWLHFSLLISNYFEYVIQILFSLDIFKTEDLKYISEHSSHSERWDLEGWSLFVFFFNSFFLIYLFCYLFQMLTPKNVNHIEEIPVILINRWVGSRLAILCISMSLLKLHLERCSTFFRKYWEHSCCNWRTQDHMFFSRDYH